MVLVGKWVNIGGYKEGGSEQIAQWQSCNLIVLLLVTQIVSKTVLPQHCSPVSHWLLTSDGDHEDDWRWAANQSYEAYMLVDTLPPFIVGNLKKSSVLAWWGINFISLNSHPRSSSSLFQHERWDGFLCLHFGPNCSSAWSCGVAVLMLKWTAETPVNSRLVRFHPLPRVGDRISLVLFQG